MSEEAKLSYQIDVYQVKIDKAEYEVSIYHKNNKISKIKICSYLSNKFSEITFDEFKAILTTIRKYIQIL